jgi:glycosyltransferase involved in cell wall biosynthesis
MTRFSTVIAAYNQRDRVLDAIESVERQTHAAHEVIVVDDGSSDGTAAAVRTRYPGTRVVEQPNRGKGIARNHGAFLATGDWLCFLDHDDLWHPEKLASISAYLAERDDVVAVDHGVWIFQEESDGREMAWGLRIDFTARTLDEAMHGVRALGKPTNDFSYLERNGRTYEASLHRIFSTTSALCIRRDVFFQAGGFHPAQVNGEDWALSINVARLGEWHTLPDGLSLQRFMPTADTTDPAGMVMIMTTLVNHWYGGRPLRRRTRGFEFVDELPKYAHQNRWLAQAAIWHGVRRRTLRGAGSALWLSMLLLPRWRDRLYALVPPPITWRIEHHLLRRRR